MAEHNMMIMARIIQTSLSPQVKLKDFMVLPSAARS